MGSACSGGACGASAEYREASALFLQARSTAPIADSLRRDQAALDDVLHRTSQSLPLTPHHE
ncbi:hypothetical protein C8D87_101267 [Lentzea atacamensis]|uniref:Uncharacterized protein n=1 Tax=Lentzea atacamensis TaxID=531938 RepID=A0ABX9EFK4_9PSEU|nr:hypothetical protein [Lentzea atacamensis]RAS69967.1 hypothetical protein C8D87_101267 [Lentzea atacamensis]